MYVPPFILYVVGVVTNSHCASSLSPGKSRVNVHFYGIYYKRSLTDKNSVLIQCFNNYRC